MPKQNLAMYVLIADSLPIGLFNKLTEVKEWLKEYDKQVKPRNRPEQIAICRPKACKQFNILYWSIQNMEILYRYVNPERLFEQSINQEIRTYTSTEINDFIRRLENGNEHNI